MAIPEEQTFLAQYLTPEEMAYYNQTKTRPAVNTSLWGKVLCLDSPIKDIDRMMAKILVDLTRQGFTNFSAIVANEGGALLGALLSARYTPQEIIKLRTSGDLDPIGAIEYKQKLTGRLAFLHKRTGGADHKGGHFRDQIDDLLRKKVIGSEDHPVTFAELDRLPGAPKLLIKVFDSVLGCPIVLSAATQPTMAVADAVLASCAVIPYIRALTYVEAGKTPEAKAVTHQFWSCSTLETLPVDDGRKALLAMGIKDDYSTRYIGYGYNGTTSLVADTTGSDYASNIMATRAKAIIPAELSRGLTRLF